MHEGGREGLDKFAADKLNRKLILAGLKTLSIKCQVYSVQFQLLYSLIINVTPGFFF